MTTRFKLMRFLLLMGVAAIIVCGVGVFYSHRTGHGTTVEEWTVYDIGEKAGEKALRGATLPTEAELNTTAQKYFAQQGPPEQLQNPSRDGDLQAFKQAFEKDYTAGYKKTHPEQ
jgi:hypothetical protein